MNWMNSRLKMVPAEKKSCQSHGLEAVVKWPRLIVLSSLGFACQSDGRTVLWIPRKEAVTGIACLYMEDIRCHGQEPQ